MEISNHSFAIITQLHPTLCLLAILILVVDGFLFSCENFFFFFRLRFPSVVFHRGFSFSGYFFHVQNKIRTFHPPWTQKFWLSFFLAFQLFILYQSGCHGHQQHFNVSRCTNTSSYCSEIAAVFEIV